MSKILAITHNDRFHADDVFAGAVLTLLYKDSIEFKRTRDENEIKKGDIVFDVGGFYNSDKNLFDHHQKEGAGKRENGIPYASFGLVWKKWGEEICESKEVADLVDKNLVQSVDAGDNGFSFYTYNNTELDLTEYNLNHLISIFGSTWKETDNFDEEYLEVIKMAIKILKREITVAKHKIEAIPLLNKFYEKTEDKRVLILDDYLPFGSFVKKHDEILFVVSPSKDKDVWRVNTVKKEGFISRKDLPKNWGGLRDKDLEKVTGVKGTIFCHRNLFLAVTDNKNSAIELVKLALKN